MKYLFIIIASMMFSLLCQAQFFPQSFAYQAVLRNDQGNILADTDINVRLTIQWDAFGQYNDLYIETHQTSTNEHGLINLTVGSGVPGNGIYPSFNEVLWIWWGYLLKVEVDTGDGYINLGQETMSAVPYSMYSKGNWGLYGNPDTDETEHFIGTIDNQNLNFRANNEPWMTLTTNGRLGIGTETPGSLIEIYDSQSIVPSIKFGHFQEAGSATVGLLVDDFTIENTCEDGQIRLISGEGKLYVDPIGRIGIDTNNPLAKLHITGGSDLVLDTPNSGYFILGPTNGGNISMDNNEIISRNNGVAATLFLNTEGGAVVVNQNTTPPYDFYVNGSAAKPGGGSWSSYSDFNMKKNIKQYQNGLNEILQVNPISYNYKEGLGMDSNIKYVGIIAQELEPIVPEMIKKTPTVLEDGSIEEYMSVDPSAFIYMLINSVKELNAEIEKMQREIIELKSSQQK